ncbi:unnamed protein product [Schistocephalus solidus]|uniref:Uncharacterized protein n=1 Tax=Schistocephalus solidus TaxID=70667 RepID=A0A183SI82_SCHSO|nr:unnamed protein product [Schistocephalus solidus]
MLSARGVKEYECGTAGPRRAEGNVRTSLKAPVLLFAGPLGTPRQSGCQSLLLYKAVDSEPGVTRAESCFKVVLQSHLDFSRLELLSTINLRSFPSLSSLILPARSTRHANEG